MSATVAPRCVIAGFDAQPGERFDRLRDLILAVIDLGWEPDVVLVGDGDRLRDLRREVPVTVVDEFRRRGIAAVPHLLGMAKATRGLKRARLQRWSRVRADLPWIVGDPRAAAMLRYVGGAHGPVVGALLAGADHPDALAPRDRETLAPAAAWLVGSDEQAEAVAAAGFGPALVTGRLGRPDPSLATDSTWPLLLVPTIGAWSEVNHTTEVVVRLLERHPSIPIHWLVRNHEDQWLAHFDLDQLGLDDIVTLIWPAESPVERYRTVIRTGYGPVEIDRCVEARRAGVPVVAFAGSGRDRDPRAVPPFDVDGLLAEVDRVLPDEDTIRLRQDRYGQAVEAHAAALARLGDLLGGLGDAR